MTILDAYAVVALLKGEPAAAQVKHLVDAGNAALTPIGVAEVLDHLVRVVGATEEEAVLDLAQLGLEVPTPIDDELSQTAGLLRARHYHRSRRAVSLADCIAAAVSADSGRPLATSDPHLLDLCADEGLPITVLPDSSGITWSHDSI